MAVAATHAQEPVLESATAKIVLKLAVHERRQRTAPSAHRLDELRVVSLDDLVEQCLFGSMAPIAGGADRPVRGRYLHHASRPCESAVRIAWASLGIVIRAISAHLIGKAGLRRRRARTGAVTLIQRFGGALNLNIHFHMIFLDGVYDLRRGGRPRFVAVPAPTAVEMAVLVQRIGARIGRHLERRGILVRDAENAWLDVDAEQISPLDDLAARFGDDIGT